MTTAHTSTSPSEQIEALEQQIEQLKHRAVLELKVKLGEARAHVAALQAQLAKMTGEKASAASHEEAPAKRRKRGKASIEQIAQAIREGATNHRAIGRVLGVSSAAVASKIKEQGAAAGISSTGQKGSFKLHVK